jgi:hypothetical protein
VALLPLAAVAVAAYLARSHHPATAAEAGGPELAAFSVEGYEDPGNTSLS